MRRSIALPRFIWEWDGAGFESSEVLPADSATVRRMLGSPPSEEDVVEQLDGPNAFVAVDPAMHEVRRQGEHAAAPGDQGHVTQVMVPCTAKLLDGRRRCFSHRRRGASGHHHSRCNLNHSKQLTPSFAPPARSGQKPSLVRRCVVSNRRNAHTVFHLLPMWH